MKTLSILLALMLTAVHAVTPPADEPEHLGAHYTQLLYMGELEPIWEQFSPEMQELFGSFDGFVAFQEEVTAQLGAEVTVLEEIVREEDGLTVYLRSSLFENLELPILTQWTTDPAGTVHGFLITPQDARPEVPPGAFNDETPTALRIASDDERFVVRGAAL